MTLFERVVAASGLSEVFAEKALRIALERAGADPDALTPHALRIALPEVESTIAAFLQMHEVPERMREIGRLAGVSATFAAVKPKP